MIATNWKILTVQIAFTNAHENLRPVPKGHTGLLEITDSLLNEEETVSASDELTQNCNDFGDTPNFGDMLRADSVTASADSETLTAWSDTLSFYDSDTLDVQYEVEVHTEQDRP